MKILVTGFEPFGGEEMNPAYEVVKLLPNSIIDAVIIKLEIPTVFYKSADVVKKAIDKYKPDVVLCIGQAGGRSVISVEKVAINLDEARIPDNDGQQPIDKTIKEDGETAYFTNLPIKAMVKNIKEHGIPSGISYTAGTYVCNHIMYNLLYMIDKEYANMKGGFIHVPFDVSQVIGQPIGTPSMPIVYIAKGIEYAIEAIIKNEKDIGDVAGEIQ